MTRNTDNLQGNVSSVEGEEELHRVLDRGFDNPEADEAHLIVREVLCAVSCRPGRYGI